MTRGISHPHIMSKHNLMPTRNARNSHKFRSISKQTTSKKTRNWRESTVTGKSVSIAHIKSITYQEGRMFLSVTRQTNILEMETV